MRRREAEGGIHNNSPLLSLFCHSDDRGKDRERDGVREIGRERERGRARLRSLDV